MRLKLLLFLGLLVGGYAYFLQQASQAALGSYTQVAERYRYVADHSTEIATGRAQ